MDERKRKRADNCSHCGKQLETKQGGYKRVKLDGKFTEIIHGILNVDITPDENEPTNHFLCYTCRAILNNIKRAEDKRAASLAHFKESMSEQSYIGRKMSLANTPDSRPSTSRSVAFPAKMHCCNCLMKFEVKNRGYQRYKLFKDVEQTACPADIIHRYFKVDIYPSDNKPFTPNQYFLCPACYVAIQNIKRLDEKRVALKGQLNTAMSEYSYIGAKVLCEVARSSLSSPSHSLQQPLNEKTPSSGQNSEQCTTERTPSSRQGKRNLKTSSKQRCRARTVGKKTLPLGTHKTVRPIPVTNIGAGVNDIMKGRYYAGFLRIYRNSVAGKRDIIRLVEYVVRQEVKKNLGNKDSVLRTEHKNVTPTSMQEFSWKAVSVETKEQCPMMFAALKGATTSKCLPHWPKKKRMRIKKDDRRIRGVCTAIIGNHKNNFYINRFQKINSVHMWLAGCQRRAFDDFARLCWCQSITVTRPEINQKFGGLPNGTALEKQGGIAYSEALERLGSSGGKAYSEALERLASSDGNASGEVLEGQGSSGAIASGEVLDGQGSSGAIASGEALDGQGSSGAIASGEALEGQGSSDGNASGEALEGQGSSGQADQDMNAVTVNLGDLVKNLVPVEDLDDHDENGHSSPMTADLVQELEGHVQKACSSGINADEEEEPHGDDDLEEEEPMDDSDGPLSEGLSDEEPYESASDDGWEKTLAVFEKKYERTSKMPPPKPAEEPKKTPTPKPAEPKKGQRKSDLKSAKKVPAKSKSGSASGLRTGKTKTLLIRGMKSILGQKSGQGSNVICEKCGEQEDHYNHNQDSHVDGGKKKEKAIRGKKNTRGQKNVQRSNVRQGRGGEQEDSHVDSGKKKQEIRQGKKSSRGQKRGQRSNVRQERGGEQDDDYNHIDSVEKGSSHGQKRGQRSNVRQERGDEQDNDYNHVDSVEQGSSHGQKSGQGSSVICEKCGEQEDLNSHVDCISIIQQSRYRQKNNGPQRGSHGRGNANGRVNSGNGRGQADGKPGEWIPETKLGWLVKDAKIKSLEEIYLLSLPIKEAEIINFFLGSTLKNEVLKVMSIQKKTQNGPETRFKAFVAVGDCNGHVGLGVKCSKDVVSAIKGAIILATQSIVPVRRGYWGEPAGETHTVPYKVTGECGGVTVRLIPAPQGAGIVSAPVPKKLLTMAGIKDCYTTATGATATIGNFAKATFAALMNTNDYLASDKRKDPVLMDHQYALMA